MKILTVRQPWADAMFLTDEPKDVENRTWSTKYRGLVAIHAGLIIDTWALDMVDVDRELMVTGAIRGVVEIVGCHSSEDCWTGSGGCSTWAEHNDPDEKTVHHVELANPREIPWSIGTKGTLGLRDLDPAVEARIWDQLGGRES